MKITQVVRLYNTKSLRQALDYLVLFLIVVSIITLSIETLPNLNPATKKKLDILEVVITVFFTIEYVARIAFSQKKSKYIFSFFGILDLIAILPFYLSLGVDLRAVRAFRLFRIFRILKLAKYDVAMARLGKAFSYMRKEISIFLFTTFILLYLSAALVYFFEHPAQPEKFQSIFHSLWWAVCTLTTVGYGDVYPITALGRILTFIILMLGMSIVAVPAGLIATALSKVIKDEEQEG